MSIITLLVFIIVLSFLVLIHEFGHFIGAKLNGIQVEEFGLGFPPRLFGKKWGGTLYSINALPIGGFVKLYGEEYQELQQKKGDKSHTKAFSYKKPYQKAMVIVAGVFMNIVLAVVLYYIILATSQFQSGLIPTITPYKFRFGEQVGRVVIVDIIKNSPAERARIKPDESIVSINNERITSSRQVINLIDHSNNEPVTISLKNIDNGNLENIRVKPQYSIQLKRNVIGASLVDASVIQYRPGTERLLSGLYQSYNMFAYNVAMIKYLALSSLQHKTAGPVSEAIAGPVGIYGVFRQIIQTSGNMIMVNLLNFVALLSLSLGFINIIPFPALDGGRLVFVIYEWVTKKRVNQKIEQYVNIFGFIVLVSLAVLVTINDILRFMR